MAWLEELFFCLHMVPLNLNSNIIDQSLHVILYIGLYLHSTGLYISPKTILSPSPLKRYFSPPAVRYAIFLLAHHFYLYIVHFSLYLTLLTSIFPSLFLSLPFLSPLLPLSYLILICFPPKTLAKIYFPLPRLYAWQRKMERLII